MTSDTTVHEHEWNGKWNGQQPRTRRRPPAMTFTHGNIRTRIWANPSYLGDVIWKIDQVRLYSRPGKSGEARTYEPGDLWDVMRGAHLARAWIRKKERWLWLSRLFFRSWFVF